jgi:hypothetical protein
MCQALNGSGSSDLLFLALDRLYPDMVGRMGADVCDKVTDVRRVWERCVVEHPPAFLKKRALHWKLSQGPGRWDPKKRTQDTGFQFAYGLILKELVLPFFISN